MSHILRQHISITRGKILADGWIPVSLHFANSDRTTVHFSNNKTTFTTCLSCPDTPCATFSNEEVTPSNFDRFPADRNLDVCAAGAITIVEGDGAPSIDSELCILCGACTSRCPIGAIRLVPGQGAIVENAPNEAFIDVSMPEPGHIIAIRNLFEPIPQEGTQLIESDIVVKEIFTKMAIAWKRMGDRFPNMLARNLLIGAGIGASVGRKGNNHMRMDIILSPPGVEQGFAEVEFGQDAVLDAPRDTMDSLAVLISRYNWTQKSTFAIIVSDVLPNRRSEYWHIIQDISNVLGVRIGTVTIFALMLYNWNRKVFDPRGGQIFYVDRETLSYRAEVLERVMERTLYLGLSPCPQIDIAK